MDLGDRPRLADHVALRRHRIGEHTLVVLHDLSAGGHAEVGAREHRLLSHADGSRDVAGIVAAAAAEGLRVSPDDVRSFFARLDAAGMLERGVAEPAPTAGDPQPIFDPPLQPMPGFSLRCDGSGSCCRIYPTTSFAPLEMLRARALAPEVLSCGDDARAAFTPERGARFAPWLAATVCQVDGRCAFLDDEQRCVIHRRGGADAKPLGCRLFPARFVDDGSAVRVAPAPECACVFASAGGSSGEPLVDSAIRRRSQLPAGAYVCSLDRKQARLGAELEAAFAASCDQDDFDALSFLCERAATLAPDDALAAARSRLAACARRHLERCDWRHAGDLARRVPEWMLAAKPHGRHDPPPDTLARRDELTYVRCVSFGRLWLLDDVDPGVSLWARAARVSCARAMRAVPMTGIPSGVAAHPLAAIEALARGFGW